MTLGDIATYARFLTNTDTTSWTDAQLLINTNSAYQKVVSMILESADESDFDDARATDYPIVETSLTTNRDYTIPVSEKVLKIKRIDVTYNGTDYYKAEPIDDGEVGFDMGANSTNTDQNFIRQAPRYDIKYNSIWLYPKPAQADVDAGGKLRIEWTRQVTEFTLSDLSTGTAVPGFDDPFHPLIPYTAAHEYAVARQLPQLQQLQQGLADWETRLRQHYSRKALDRRLQVTSAYDDSYGR